MNRKEEKMWIIGHH